MLRFRISIVITSVEIQDDFDLILHKVDSHKAFRISPWILRFINNCKENKKSGLLRTVELVNQKKIDIKCEQEEIASFDRFGDDKRRTNLKKK